MILDFGHINTEIRIKTSFWDQDDLENQKAQACAINPGGRAFNQAVAAARTGAKVSLIGAIGNDPYAQIILDTLRREGIGAGGLSRHELPTGTAIFTGNETGIQKTVTHVGANALASADQISDGSLSPKTLLLLQTNVEPEQNRSLLERARQKNAITILNLSPSVDLKLSTLKLVNYLIVNRVEAETLCQTLGLKAQTDALLLARSLAEAAKLNCIVTIGERGCVAVSDTGTGWSIGVLEGTQIVDSAGAEDSFAGTFAACIQAGHTLPRAMKRASIAATLTCGTFGTLNAFPHLDAIENVINSLTDAKEEEPA